MTGKPFAIIEAPSVLGLRPRRRDVKEALLGVGLAERLGARHAGRIEPPAYDPRATPRPCCSTQTPSPTTRSRSPTPSAPYRGRRVPHGARRRLLGLARHPSGAPPPGPLGLCSSTVTPTLPTRGRAERRGRLDGPGAGHRPRARGLTNIEGRRPLVRDTDVVVLGRRDADAGVCGSRRLVDTSIDLIDLAAVRCSAPQGRGAWLSRVCQSRARRVLGPPRRRRARRRGLAGGRLPHARRAGVGGARDHPARRCCKRPSCRNRNNYLQPEARRRWVDRTSVHGGDRPGADVVMFFFFFCLS